MARWSAALLNLYAPAGHWQALSTTLPCDETAVATHDEHDLTIRAARMLIQPFQSSTVIRIYRA